MEKNCEIPQCWSTVWLWLGFHENKRRKDLFLLQHTNFYLWSLLFCLLQMNLMYCGIVIIILIVPHFFTVILLVSYYQNSCFWCMIVTNNHAQILFTALVCHGHFVRSIFWREFFVMKDVLHTNQHNAFMSASK